MIAAILEPFWIFATTFFATSAKRKPKPKSGIASTAAAVFINAGEISVEGSCGAGAMFIIGIDVCAGIVTCGRGAATTGGGVARGATTGRGGTIGVTGATGAAFASGGEVNGAEGGGTRGITSGRGGTTDAIGRVCISGVGLIESFVKSGIRTKGVTGAGAGAFGTIVGDTGDTTSRGIPVFSRCSAVGMTAD